MMNVRWMIIASASVLAATACTTGKAKPVAGASPSRTRSFASGAVSITPAAHLRDGERVQVTLAGFPHDSKVWLSECAAASDATAVGCGDQLAAQPFVLTGADGAGKGDFIIRALASTGRQQTATVRCHKNCVLVATAGAIPNPVFGIAPLNFSSHA